MRVPRQGRDIMPNPAISFVDSHVHLDLLRQEAPSRISWLNQVGCLPVSWSFGWGIETKNDLKTYLRVNAETIRDIRRGPLECFYLAGVHPRNIPEDLKPEMVEDLLLPFLDDPLCLGIGEIGLEVGGSHEEEIFLAQMEMAGEMAQRGMVFGVHTPRRGKIPVTGRILSILEDFLGYGDRIVVDHCIPETVEKVLEMGLRAGVTLSPAKSSATDIIEIVKSHFDRTGRIMLNTDSGDIFHEDLYDFYRSNELEGDIKRGLTGGNAARFFGIAIPL